MCVPPRLGGCRHPSRPGALDEACAKQFLGNAAKGRRWRRRRRFDDNLNLDPSRRRGGRRRRRRGSGGLNNDLRCRCGSLRRRRHDDDRRRGGRGSHGRSRGVLAAAASGRDHGDRHDRAKQNQASASQTFHRRPPSHDPRPTRPMQGSTTRRDYERRIVGGWSQRYATLTHQETSVATDFGEVGRKQGRKRQMPWVSLPAPVRRQRVRALSDLLQEDERLEGGGRLTLRIRASYTGRPPARTLWPVRRCCMDSAYSI